MAGATFHDLCVAYMASETGRARLECGCLAGRGVLSPCPWHRDEVMNDLLRSTEEDPGECDEGCCDP